MIKIKLRRVVAVLGVIVIVAGSYIGWQLYNGQQMVNQYVADAQKLARGSANGSTSSNYLRLGSSGIAPQNSTTPDQEDPRSQPNSSVPPSSGAPSSGAYKQMMSSSYQQTLQAMQNVRRNTLALQEKKLSLSAYKASILESQGTFSSAEAFVRANPPTEEKLYASYQELLAGISLAKDSMGVVLNGISSYSPSNLYAARKMGLKAYQQVTDAYAHF